MGRTILTEENLKDKVYGLFQSHKWQIGLIIGQLSSKKDFIVHLAKCPDPVEDEAEIESCQDESNMPNKLEGKTRTKSLKLSYAEEINENWITEHARQVNRMLPGGLNIVGVFIFCSPEFLNKNQSKLRQCIHEVCKVTEKNRFIKSATAHSNRILLHICTSTRKITCRTIDILDKLVALQPAELKYQSFISTWNSVRCILNIDVQFQIPVSSEKSRLETQILQGFQTELERIWECMAVIDGKLANSDEPLFEQAKLSKGKTNKEKPKTSDVELYTSHSGERSEKMTKHTCLGNINFVGKLFSQAHLHAKATKGEAIKAIKADIIRSILSRLQLLCEEAEVNNLYQVKNWSLLSPTRVIVPLNGSPISFCDYVFKDEQSLDSVQRFCELLSIPASEESLLVLEKPPDDEMAARMSLESGQGSSIEKLTEQACSNNSSERNDIFVLLVGVLLAVTAVFVSFIYVR